MLLYIYIYIIILVLFQATKVRKKKKRANTDFADNFQFNGADLPSEDHMDGLKKFLEKTTPSSLQINI